MLGFAMRAGKVIIGLDLICRNLSSKRVKLVLLSEGASENTKKKILNKCSFYNVRALITEIPPDTLGKLLGKLYAPSAVAITDARFADEIFKARKCLCPNGLQPLQRKDVSDGGNG